MKKEYVFGKVLDVREIYDNFSEKSVICIILLKTDGTRERYSNLYYETKDFSCRIYYVCTYDYDWSYVVAGDYVEITIMNKSDIRDRNLLKIIDKNELNEDTIRKLEG